MDEVEGAGEFEGDGDEEARSERGGTRLQHRETETDRTESVQEETDRTESTQDESDRTESTQAESDQAESDDEQGLTQEARRRGGERSAQQLERDEQGRFRSSE
jgi:hypothetical protein